MIPLAILDQHRVADLRPSSSAMPCHPDRAFGHSLFRNTMTSSLEVELAAAHKCAGEVWPATLVVQVNVDPSHRVCAPRHQYSHVSSAPLVCRSCHVLFETTGLPAETTKALDDWLHKKKYRYLIMNVPGMEVTAAPREKNYADFKAHIMKCPGVCLGAFDFGWEIPRGHGHVPTDEPAMFTWAPDAAPPGLGMMAFMRLKMQMPMKIDEVKKAMGNWNGAFIQCNSEAELHPTWVVPKLRGGRMGSRKASSCL